jgi:hypothetical protein
MESGYREDFGIDIEIIQDLPFAEYQIPLDQGRCIPGLIFLAKIKEPSQRIKLDTEKHQDFNWIDTESLSNINDNDLVPNAKQTIREALEKITIRS